MPDRINIVDWHRFVRDVYDVAPGVRGALGALSVVNAAIGNMLEMRTGVSSDVYTTQGFKSWDDRLSVLQQRMTFYLKELKRPLADGTPYDEIEPYIVPPLFDGRYPADFGGALVGRLTVRRGLTREPDGTYSGLGDVNEVGILFNEVVEALTLSEAIDKESDLPRWLRAILSQAAHQYLEEAAPHEDPTVRDVVEEKISDAAEKAAELLEDAAQAVTGLGFGGLVIGAGVVVGGYFALRWLVNRRGR